MSPEYGSFREFGSIHPRLADCVDKVLSPGGMNHLHKRDGMVVIQTNGHLDIRLETCDLSRQERLQAMFDSSGIHLIRVLPVSDKVRTAADFLEMEFIPHGVSIDRYQIRILLRDLASYLSGRDNS